MEIFDFTDLRNESLMNWNAGLILYYISLNLCAILNNNRSA